MHMKISQASVCVRPSFLDFRVTSAFASSHTGEVDTVEVLLLLAETHMVSAISIMLSLDLPVRLKHCNIEGLGLAECQDP